MGGEPQGEAGTWGLSGGERELWRKGQGAKDGAGSGAQSLGLGTLEPGLSRPLVAT